MGCAAGAADSDKFMPSCAEAVDAEVNLEEDCAAMDAHQRQLVMMTTMEAKMPHTRKHMTTGAVSVGRPGSTGDTAVDRPSRGILTHLPPLHS
jgi:hypothetical protein